MNIVGHAEVVRQRAGELCGFAESNADAAMLAGIESLCLELSGLRSMGACERVMSMGMYAPARDLDAVHRMDALGAQAMVRIDAYLGSVNGQNRSETILETSSWIGLGTAVVSLLGIVL